MVDLSRVRLSGPLVPDVEGFAAWLTQRGYPPSSVLFHVRRLAHVSRWLGARGVTGCVVEPAVVDAFVGGLPADRRLARLRPGAFEPTWEYLRSVGAVLPATVQPPGTAVDVLLARYAGYLSVERGLAERTIARDVGLVRAFLTGRVREGRLELAELTAGE
jgi:integrase/recombinase XerD